MVTWSPSEIAGRTAAAVAGGYLLANTAAGLGAAVLPLSRHEAVTWATIAAFPVFLMAILWAFAASSHRKAWVGVLTPTAVGLLGLAVLAR